MCTYLWKYSYFKGIKYVETHKTSHLSMVRNKKLHKLIHMKSSPKKPPKPIAILEFVLNLSANSSLAKLCHKAHHLGQELKWWTKILKRKDNK